MNRMELTDKQKFRNSSAAYQQNFTNEKVLNFFKGWFLAPHPSELDAPVDSEGIELEDFDPETKEGGDPSFTSVNDKLKKLARILPGTMTYFKEDRFRVGDILKGGNDFISKFYISRSLRTHLVSPRQAIATAEFIDSEFERIKQLDVAAKDALFVNAVGLLVNFVTNNRDFITGELRKKGNTKSSASNSYGLYMKNFMSASSINDVITGTAPVQLSISKVGRESLFIPIPHDDEQYFIFYLYNTLPSTGKGQLNAFFEYYTINNDQFIPKNTAFKIYDLIVSSANEGVRFVVNQINNFEELDSQFRNFLSSAPNLSDAELKEIYDNIIKLEKAFDGLLSDDLYLRLGEKAIPNIITKSIAIPTAIVRMSAGMMKLWNIEYKKFRETYIALMKNLKSSRNF